MNTTAFAGHARLCGAVAVIIVGWLALAPCVAAASAADAGSNTTYLEFSVAPRPLTTWGLTLRREPKAFQKEPDTGGRKVCRGSFNLETGADEGTAFLWDYTKGKIYLDLNHNRDLTDDPQGNLSCPVSRYNYYVQSFMNVQLKVKTARGNYPVTLDITLYAPEGNRLNGSAGIRSFWEGRLSLGGRDYQIGRIDRVPGQFGMENEGALLLRPWEQRSQPWDLMNGNLAAFDFTQNLFFAGRAYRVDCLLVERDQEPRFKVSFREKEAELGELKLTGQYIDRLVLSAKRQRQRAPLNAGKVNEDSSSFTVVLDQPPATVKVPAGEYETCRVFLRSGGVAAYNELRYYNNSKTVSVSANNTQPTVLAIGGPLTNSVTASARGKDLSLNYCLLGGGGETYQLATVDRSRPPRFVIYKNGQRIHSGQFEFG